VDGVLNQLMAGELLVETNRGSPARPNQNLNLKSKPQMKLKMKNAELSIGLLALLLVPAAGFNATAQSDVRYGLEPRWNRLAAATGAVTTNALATTFSYGGTNYDRTASGTVIIPVYRGRGVAFFGSIQDAANTNAQETFGLDLSYDGTNWTTTQPVRFTGSCAGATATVFYTNVIADVFDNARFARLTSITGNTSGNNVTNNWLAWSTFQ
jgi:hypothetical protein